MSQKRRKPSRVESGDDDRAATTTAAKNVNFNRIPVRQPSAAYTVLTTPDLLVKTLAGLSNVSLFGTGYICELRDLAALSQVCMRTYQMLREDGNLAIIRGYWLRHQEKEVWKAFGDKPETFLQYLCLNADLRCILQGRAAFLFKYILERTSRHLFKWWKASGRDSHVFVPAQLLSLEDTATLICEEIQSVSAPVNTAAIVCDETQSVSVAVRCQMMRQLCAFLDRHADKISICHRLLNIGRGAASAHEHLVFDCVIDYWYGDGQGKRGAEVDAKWQLAMMLSGIAPDVYDWLSYRVSHYHLRFKDALVFDYVKKVFSSGRTLVENQEVQFRHALVLLGAVAYPERGAVPPPASEWEKMIDWATGPAANAHHLLGDELVQIVTLYKIYLAVLQSGSIDTFAWLLRHVGTTQFLRGVFFYLIGRGVTKSQIAWVELAERLAKIDYADRDTRTRVEGLISAGHGDDHEDDDVKTVKWQLAEKLIPVPMTRTRNKGP